MPAGSKNLNTAKLKTEIWVCFVVAVFFVFAGLFYLFREYGYSFDNKIRAAFFLLMVLGLIWCIIRRVKVLCFSKGMRTPEKIYEPK